MQVGHRAHLLHNEDAVFAYLFQLGFVGSCLQEF